MENINELALKLKNEAVKQLTKNEQLNNIPYVVRDDIKYTRIQLSNEIENETNVGIEILAGMLMLALDLLSRQK